MLKGTLRFAIVVEAELIDRAVVDGPGMADIPLLKALSDGGGEAGYVGSGGLELSEGQDHMVIVEIVVDAEGLLVINSVVHLDRELVAALWLYRHGLSLIGSYIGGRHEVLEAY